MRHAHVVLKVSTN